MNSGVDILVEAKDNGTSHQRATCTEPKPDAVEVSHFATVQYWETSHFMYRPRFAGSGYPSATAPSEAQKRPAL